MTLFSARDLPVFEIIARNGAAMWRDQPRCNCISRFGYLRNFACWARGALVIGYDEVVRQIGDGRRYDVEVVTPLTAACEAFIKLGIKSISSLTPYIDSVTRSMCEYIEREGVNVLNAKSFYAENDIDIARLSPASIKAAALESSDSGTDAYFFPVQRFALPDVIEELENELDIPVLSSNQCMFWQALCRSGYTEPIKGFGQLMMR